MSALAVFVAWPWLALIPAMLFLALYGLSNRRLALGTALAWAAYAVYEYGMYRRWLCTGECNIRVDLLLLYPVLFLTSLIAGIVVLRGRRP